MIAYHKLRLVSIQQTEDAGNAACPQGAALLEARTKALVAKASHHEGHEEHEGIQRRKQSIASLHSGEICTISAAVHDRSNSILRGEFFLSSGLCRLKRAKKTGQAPRLFQESKIIPPRRTRKAKRLVTRASHHEGHEEHEGIQRRKQSIASLHSCEICTTSAAVHDRSNSILRVLRALRGDLSLFQLATHTSTG